MPLIEIMNSKSETDLGEDKKKCLVLNSEAPMEHLDRVRRSQHIIWGKPQTWTKMLQYWMWNEQRKGGYRLWKSSMFKR